MQSASEIERKLKDENPNVKLNEKILNTLINEIADNENVLYVMDGNSTCESNLPGVGRTVKDAIIFLTDKKVFIVIKNIMSYNSMSIPLDSITGVSTNKIIFGRTLVRLNYNAMDTEMAINSKEIADRFVRILNIQINKSKRENEEENSGENILEQIEKLSELLKQGIITEEEFTTKKKELLERL